MNHYEIKCLFNNEVIKCDSLYCSESEACKKFHKYIKTYKDELLKSEYKEVYVDMSITIRLYEIKDNLIFPIPLGEYYLKRPCGAFNISCNGYLASDEYYIGSEI